MPLSYKKNTMGTFTLVEKESSYQVQIRQGNCLAVFLHVYKEAKPKNPAKPWVHQLVSFFADEEHIENCVKNLEKDVFKKLLYGELRDIKLNLYYKESYVLLKYFVEDGLEVQCYYEKPEE